MRRFKVFGMAGVGAVTVLIVFALDQAAQTQSGATEAPTGFRVEDNGFAEEFCANQAALAEETADSPRIPDDAGNFEAAVEAFTGAEDTAGGLGPIFNGHACAECHTANPILGATSQITERRAGFFNPATGIFTDHPGGSLIHDRSFRPHEIERVIPVFTNVIAIRSTISVLGDGFVEAIANATLQNIANAQPAAQRGLVINVPVLERPGITRIGRFGHKGQHASLLSFSADAYANDMGVTSPLQPDENTFNGQPVAEPPDAPPGVDDDGVDVALSALFMRATLAPPVDPVLLTTRAAQAGSTLFNAIGCAVCHTRTIVTAPAGTSINGGAARVSNRLGNKVIHPLGDFLLHDLGTGDGIVQNGGALSQNRVRTAPLWGLRARGRFMHDNLSFSFSAPPEIGTASFVVPGARLLRIESVSGFAQTGPVPPPGFGVNDPFVTFSTTANGNLGAHFVFEEWAGTGWFLSPGYSGSLAYADPDSTVSVLFIRKFASGTGTMTLTFTGHFMDQ